MIAAQFVLTLTHKDTTMRLLYVAACLLLFAGPCLASELWQDGGFKLECAGWADLDAAPSWTGLKCGLTVPDSSAVFINGPGSLEVFIPGRGWVRDKGMFIADGCHLNPNTSWDTALGACAIKDDQGCRRDGGRVLIIVRLPKMVTSVSPTQARWVARMVWYGKD